MGTSDGWIVPTGNLGKHSTERETLPALKSDMKHIEAVYSFFSLHVLVVHCYSPLNGSAADLDGTAGNLRE